jgi:anti-anti-sigma factor
MLGRSDSPNPRNPRRSAAFGLVQRDPNPHTAIITIEGELDLSTAPRLKWTLLDALETGHRQLVLDLSLTTFMDSTALGVLVAAKRKLTSADRLAIVCPTPDVLRIFEYAGLDEAFAIFPTLDTALAFIRAPAAETG